MNHREELAKASSEDLWRAIIRNAEDALRHLDWISYLDNIKILIAALDQRIDSYQRKQRTDQMIQQHRSMPAYLKEEVRNHALP